MSEQTLAAQLDHARRIVTDHPFDSEGALILLNDLAKQEQDIQRKGAIRHATRAVVATIRETGSVHIVIARFALARVVALLGLSEDA